MATSILYHGWGNALQVYSPVHASWLNQIEIYFSIVQRNVLMPNECPDLLTLTRALLEFQSYYEAIAKPFEWRFTRRDLAEILAKLADYTALPKKAVA